MRARVVVTVVTVGVCVLVLHLAHAQLRGPEATAGHVVHRAAAARVLPAAGVVQAAGPCTSCAPAKAGVSGKGHGRVRVHGWWLRRVVRVRRGRVWWWRRRRLARLRHPLWWLGF